MPTVIHDACKSPQTQGHFAGHSPLCRQAKRVNVERLSTLSRSTRLWRLIVVLISVLCPFSAVLAQAAGAASAPASPEYDSPSVTLEVVPWITWGGLALGVAVGALILMFRKRYLLSYPSAVAAASAVVIAVFAHQAVLSWVLNGEQKDCRSAEFGVVNSSEVAINCGSTRESAANAFGTVGLYKDLFDVGADRNRPVSAQLLKWIETGSLTAAALAGYGLAWLIWLATRRRS